MVSHAGGMNRERTKYRLTLVTHEPDPAMTLKQALKSLLRKYGLRCVDCRQVSDAPVEEVKPKDTPR